MFETILSEIKLTKESITNGKYFTATAHAGKATTAAGELGAKFFEKNNDTITTMDVPLTGKFGVSDETLKELQMECNALMSLSSSAAASMGSNEGQDLASDLVDILGPYVLKLIKRIIESRSK